MLLYRLCQNCMLIGTAMFYILMLVWMTLIFVQSHSCIRAQTLWCPFSKKKYLLIWKKNSVCCHSLLVC